MSPLAALAPARRTPPRRRQDALPESRPEVRPPLRLVEPPERRPRLRLGVVGSVLALTVAVGIFALAAAHTLVVQAQFELDRVDQRVAERQGDLEALRLEVARLESPAAITAAARDLGLVTPTDRVHLEPVLTPPAAAARGTGSGSAGDQAAATGSGTGSSSR